jgi:eukaryotic-like serine/threonine-protein kinase
MIQRPDEFYGRRKEVARVLSRVGSARPQSISLVGERRLGKSSFLFHLTWPEVRQRYLEENDRLVIVFFDLQQLRDLSPEDFFAFLLARIRAVEPDLPDTGKPGYVAFQAGLEWLSSRNKLLVLLFDEFDAITVNPLFTKEFYSFLRSMANNYPVSYVTSSRVELQILCHSTEIADSPFFNIFTNLYLKPFTRPEALELITAPSRLAGVCLEPFADEIIQIAGFLPFYLQIACSACFDCLAENVEPQLDLRLAEARFLEEASPHYDYLVSHLPEEHLAVLTAVAKGGQPGIEDHHVGRRLLRDGYLAEEDGGQVRIASRLLADHLLRFRVRPVRRQVERNREARVEVRPGSRLEQYEVLSKIGEGGMGFVYQAQDTTLDRKVALKLIRPELLDSEDFRKRFLQEARLAAALSHPVITSVYELTEHEGQVVLVMEWLEGKTLKQLIQEEGRVVWRQLAQWIAETAGGLEAAHRQRIVHRDIKSANLFVTSEGKLKILDFGLAKLLLSAAPTLLQSQFSSPGTLVGSVEYMSPEQACGQPVDNRSDLFSLGIVFFEALTGALPFRRDTLQATLHAIVSDPAPDLGLYDVEGADKVEPILNRLLAKSPARRYQNAAHLEKDLRDLVKKRSFFWFR